MRADCGMPVTGGRDPVRPGQSVNYKGAKDWSRNCNFSPGYPLWVGTCYAMQDDNLRREAQEHSEILEISQFRVGEYSTGGSAFPEFQASVRSAVRPVLSRCQPLERCADCDSSPGLEASDRPAPRPCPVASSGYPWLFPQFCVLPGFSGP